MNRDNIEYQRAALHLHWPQDEFKKKHDELCDLALSALDAQEEPAAYLVNYYEETRSGSKLNCQMASLEPHEPWNIDPKVERRELIKVTPLYERHSPAAVQALREALESLRKEWAQISRGNGIMLTTESVMAAARIDAILKEQP